MVLLRLPKARCQLSFSRHHHEYLTPNIIPEPLHCKELSYVVYMKLSALLAKGAWSHLFYTDV